MEIEKPAAAYTIDLTGCEHLSRDVALIERIARDGSNGPTDVVCLYPAINDPAVNVALVAKALDAAEEWIGILRCSTGDVELPMGDDRDPNDIEAEVSRLFASARSALSTPPHEAGSPAPSTDGRCRPDGHCGDDAAWENFSKSYGDRTRDDLCKGDMTDFALANAQFMCDRNSLDLIVYQTAAKERIRWLSIQLARALAATEVKS